MAYIADVVTELHRWFDILNKDKFEDFLPEPIITVQKTRKNVMGHCTLWEAWQPNDEDKPGQYEINLSANWLTSVDILELVGVLHHEMIHYYHVMVGEKDCSGSIHNKKFKRTAEAHGLEVEHSKKAGFGHTHPSEELKNYYRDSVKPNQDIFALEFTPGKGEDEEKKPPRKKNLLKFTCSSCEAVAKAKKDSKLICGKCSRENELVFMEKEDEEGDNSDE